MIAANELIVKAYGLGTQIKRRGQDWGKQQGRGKYQSVKPVCREMKLPSPTLTPRTRILLGKSPQTSTVRDGLERLEDLVARSHQARTSRLHVQMEMLKLGVKGLATEGRLKSLGELHVEDTRGEYNPADALLVKYEREWEARTKREVLAQR